MTGLGATRAFGAPRTHERVPQILFGLALTLLALLAGWWLWFLAIAVNLEDRLWRENASLTQRIVAHDLSSTAVVPGPVAADERFEVAPLGGGGRPIAGTALEVRLRGSVAEAHATALARRRAMVYGEGTFLLLLVACCVIMLYRLVLAERRYQRDVESFLSRVTHEMKTPLAGVKALLQTLRAGRVPDDRMRELAELGLRQAEREEHLIENLLLAHRLRTVHEPTPVADLDAERLLTDFARHRRETMGAREGLVELRCEPGLHVRANAGAVTTILENLADNAFKYGARRFSLDCRREASHVVIVAEDDGAGFDAALVESLFEPFQRGASGTSGRHGTGLGLPISRQLAREAGGDLAGTSDGPGKGARFTLTLAAGAPAAQDDAAAHAAAGAQRMPAPDAR